MALQPLPRHRPRTGYPEVHIEEHRLLQKVSRTQFD